MNQFARSFLALFIAAFANGGSWAADYGGRIRVFGADPAVQPLAGAIADMQTALERVSGQSFPVVPAGSGPGIDLVIVSTPQAPADAAAALQGLGPEAYVLRSNGRTLTIAATDARGLANGAYDYLRRIGVRYLLPDERWTIYPKRGTTIKVDVVSGPAFRFRSFAGTGGLRSKNLPANDPASLARVKSIQDWMRRMRYGGEYRINGHAYEAFISDPSITPVLEEHPEYLAQIKGEPSPLRIVRKDGQTVLNLAAKINAGNPSAVALFCDWALKRLKDARGSIDATRHLAVSVEPSDGDGFGDNSAELPGDGSPSDQAFFVANQCAKSVNAAVPGAYVSLLAYNKHAAPPSFALEPNIIVQLAPYAFQPDPPERMMAKWRGRASKLAIYDYWSIPDWTHDEPTFDFTGVATKIRSWRDFGIEGFNAESTYSAGAMGLGHYLASHVLWDPSANAAALESEWFRLAFGRARPPMEQMLRRWAASFKPTSAELSRSFVDLEQALRLGGGDPEVAARIADFAAYVHYLRLRLEMIDAPDEAARQDAAEELVAFALSLDRMFMIHTTRLFDLTRREYPALQAAFQPGGDGWTRVRPLTRGQILALVADGRANYPSASYDLPRQAGDKPLQPERRRDLDAAHQPDASIASPDGWSPALRLTGPLKMRYRALAGATPALRVARTSALTISILGANGTPAHALDFPQSTGEEDPWTDVRIDVPPGDYTVLLTPRGGRAAGRFAIQVARRAPVTLETFLAPKSQGQPPLYFRVPADVRQLALYFPTGAPQGRFQVRDASGAPLPLKFEDNRRTVVIGVPAGMTGEIWSMHDFFSPNSPIELLNARQVFALSPAAL